MKNYFQNTYLHPGRLITIRLVNLLNREPPIETYRIETESKRVIHKRTPTAFTKSTMTKMDLWWCSPQPLPPMSVQGSSMIIPHLTLPRTHLRQDMISKGLSRRSTSPFSRLIIKSSQRRKLIRRNWTIHSINGGRKQGPNWYSRTSEKQTKNQDQKRVQRNLYTISTILLDR